MAIAEKRMTSVAIQAARSGRTTNRPDQGVERAGVEVRHERRAAEDVLVPEGQLAVAQHGTHQDVQRVVLLQVVPGDDETTADQVGQHEPEQWDGNSNA